jgi:hypothetical protein
LCCFGQLIFANCIELSDWLSPGRGTNNTLPRVLAILSLWVLSISLISQLSSLLVPHCLFFSYQMVMIGTNWIQGPGWSLVIDLCSDEQQHLANSLIAATTGAVTIICTLIGYVDLVSIFPFLSSSAQGLYVFSFLSFDCSLSRFFSLFLLLSPPLSSSYASLFSFFIVSILHFSSISFS